MTDAPVIVVRRKKVVAGGSHGSAWKIAFADFAMAMMAFFLVLWLTESTSLEEQMAISGYFTDPVGFKEGGQKYIIDLGGSGDQTLDGKAVELVTVEDAEKIIDVDTVEALAREIERKRFEQLAESIRDMIQSNETLEPYNDQIELTVTKEGLQIQILDQESRPMFDSGSDEIRGHAEEILAALAKTIGTLPNSISISGHTDASGFLGRRDYSNWELSADRANAARRVLEWNGVRTDQVMRVVGKGSSTLYLPDEPMNPINRRITILVLSQKREEGLKELFGDMQKQNIEVNDFNPSASPEEGEQQTTFDAPMVDDVLNESIPDFEFDDVFDDAPSSLPVAPAEDKEKEKDVAPSDQTVPPAALDGGDAAERDGSLDFDVVEFDGSATRDPAAGDGASDDRAVVKDRTVEEDKVEEDKGDAAAPDATPATTAPEAKPWWEQ
ncbi:MAG: flagellar motor protein MotB [Gammaproteobacteria bacterium]